jgi:DHA2 family multidrug resistance protein
VEEAASLPSAGKRWLIVFTAMAAMLMQVLDMTIANVALPHMQSALSANPETVNWVLTTYIVMTAIVTPSTGWLESRVGRRNLFTIALVGFTVSSAACGFATSLPMMVIARGLQGAFGALLMPLAQATMLDSSSIEKRAQTMTIFTTGATVGPLMGPVLGGWLTDYYSWRWVFFINIPIGIACTIAILLLLDKKRPTPRRFDLTGFVLLGLALASLQLMLDRGTQQDWFESIEIIVEAGIFIGAMWMFVIHSFTAKDPILPLALIRNSNYMIALVYMILLMGGAVAGPALIAPMLQLLMGYDTLGAGLMLMPRGIGAIIAMPLTAILLKKIDARLLVGIGLVMTGWTFWIMTGFELEMGQDQLILTSFIQGLGSGLAFMPVTILAFSTIPQQHLTEAAAFFNLSRSLGGSITLSIMGALLARSLQINHAEIGERVTSVRMPLLESGYIEQLGARTGALAQLIDVEINRQAMMIAYLNDFWVMMWCAILVTPLLFLLRKSTSASKNEAIIAD